MTQTIDPVKLKAAAEHLEWVLKQYPDSEDVQSLLRSLAPMIEDAKAGKVQAPVDRKDVPGGYHFGDGVYTSYKNPNVEDAYVEFRIEMRGGLSEKEKQLLADTEALRNSLKEGMKL